ncbi:MAG: Hsp70 family protein [Patescibacteria group bacterium]|jgi:hypothetical chaperone protein|nr:Hsp70 family protein [Patescibacteria group bacterium]
MKGTVFGLDFGTTNSALSVNINGKVKVLPIDKYSQNSNMMRSVIYFNEENQIFTGQEAIENYVDDYASGRFMQSIKSFLPDKSFNYTYVFGEKYTIEKLVSIMVSRVKKAGEELIGESVDRIVVGRPVVFSDDKEKDDLAQARLEEALRISGFKEIQFQYEPIGAAFFCEKDLEKSQEKIILIGDFGGGTSDFAVVKTRGNSSFEIDRKNDILSLGGVYIGGDSLDSAVMWEKIAKYFGKDATYKMPESEFSMPLPIWIARTLCNWHKIPLLRDRKTLETIFRVFNYCDDQKAVQALLDIIKENFGFSLFRAIENAKITLSDYHEAEIKFQHGNISIQELMTRKEFISINTNNFIDLQCCIEKTVKDSGLDFNDIDEVFITGGTSNIPFIMKIFSEIFGEGKIKKTNVFTSVAYGLGESANYLF